MTRSFLTELQAKADHKGEYNIPNEWLDAFFMKEYGWDIFTIRATPQYLLDRVLHLRTLDQLADKAKARKLNSG